MSRSRSSRTVRSATQRATIERELRRSRLDQLPALLEQVEIDAERPGAALVGDAGCVGELRACLEADEDPLVALELLRAECRALARQAATAGIEQGGVEPLTNRIDDLLRLADSVPLDTLLVATDALYADVAAFEAYVVDTMNQVQTLRLSGVAATLVLEAMDFHIAFEVLLSDEVRVLATNRGGQRVEVSIDGEPPVIEVATAEHNALTRALLHEENRPRHGATDLAMEFHTMMERELNEAGLAVGPVSPATHVRLAAKFWQLPQGSHRSAHH